MYSSTPNDLKEQQRLFDDSPLPITSYNNRNNLPSPKVENPIWELESLCTALHWRRPSYELTDRKPGSFHGPKNRLVYTMTCSIANYTSTGQSLNKKIAKNIAAVNMKKQIRSMSKKEVADICNMQCFLNPICQSQIRSITQYPNDKFK